MGGMVGVRMNSVPFSVGVSNNRPLLQVSELYTTHASVFMGEDTDNSGKEIYKRIWLEFVSVIHFNS